MLSVEKSSKLVLLDSSSIIYAYFKKKSLDCRSEFHRLYEKSRLYPEHFKYYTRMSVDEDEEGLYIEDNKHYAANFCGRTHDFNIKVSQN